MIRFIRRLFGRPSHSSATRAPALDPERFIYVRIPGDIQPAERGERFETPLQSALEALKLGEITGGGSQMASPYPDGRPRIEFCGIDVDVADRDRALVLLAETLAEQNAPPETELHYTKGGTKLLDRYSGEAWALGISRTVTHPGFGV